jgi:hypothetical protein
MEKTNNMLTQQSSSLIVLVIVGLLQNRISPVFRGFPYLLKSCVYKWKRQFTINKYDDKMNTVTSGKISFNFKDVTKIPLVVKNIL